MSEALRLADALFECYHMSVGGPDLEAAAELRRLHAENEALQSNVKRWRDIHDAIVKDADKAHELLCWAETEMRYAGWGTRLNDQHGRTDVYETIVEFLK